MGTLRSKMQHVAALTAGIAFVAVMIRADSTPADTQPPSVDDAPPTDLHEEPITGDPVEPAPGDETGPIHPFDPPPESNRAVAFDGLDQEEQAYVVANENVDGWDDIHTGFSVATHEAAEDAEAEAAANALGIPAIATVGVVQ